MRVNWKGNPGNKSLLDASLEVSLAYLESQECSCFTNELSLMHYVRAWLFASSR